MTESIKKTPLARFSELSSSAGAERAQHSPIVIIPLGSQEQHGPALPVGTDALLAQAVAERVVRSESRATLLEAVPFGCSWHHTSFFGTVTLKPRTYISLLVDVASSVHRDGLLPLFLNGHGGNRAAIEVALYELAELDILALSMSYFEMIAADVPSLLPELVGASGHAGLMETSLSLHLWPELVGEVPVAPQQNDVWPTRGLFLNSPVKTVRQFSEVSPTGIVGDPTAATPELGERILDLAVRRTLEAVRRADQTYCTPAPKVEP